MVDNAAIQNQWIYQYIDESCSTSWTLEVNETFPQNPGSNHNTSSVT
jgi:hypothetical protein